MSACRSTLAVLVTLCALAAVLAVLPAVAAAEECPNAAFRTGPSAHLPDCRAYELVTPPFKNGARIAEEAIGPEGSLLLDIGAATAGLEGFPDTGLETGAVADYSISRSASGWVTVPDDPPASEYAAYRPGGYLTDLGGMSRDMQTTAWLERRLGQPENSVGIFLRRADRSIVEVGPALPPMTPSGTPEGVGAAAGMNMVGISADASHLFFWLARDFWPFDNTEAGGQEGNNSLYEYAGVGNTTPMLVGVSDGSTVVDGRALPAGELISRCGIGLASLLRHSPNAVSADGDTVFFVPHTGCTGAPPVEEVFARVDNGLPGARTVAISEPTEGDCSACYEDGRLVSEGELANARFMGASEDGSKAFFETTQPLLGGDASPNLYEYDFDAPPGQRIVRVSGGDATVSNPTADVLFENSGQIWQQVSEDGSHVYFLARGVLTKTPNRQDESAEAGAINLYVFERDAEYPSGRTAFIAQLSPRDLGKAGSENAEGFQSYVTPDGRFLAFTSNRDLTPDDTSTVRQLFEYDAQTGVLVRVSIGEGGFNHDGNTPANFVTIPRNKTGRTMSDDGSYVFFQSGAALTPDALEGEGVQNVYEYHDGRVSLISDGQDLATIDGESLVRLLGTDESGGDVFFTTTDRLVGQDVDTNTDVYDARIDGGLPAPAAPVSCAGEGCQGPLSGAPTLLSPGSELQVGGNPPLAGEPAAKPKKKLKQQKSKSKKKGGKGRRARRRGKQAGKSSDRRGARS
jgi:WD40-like Beta Propeller Repeat